MQSLSGRLTEIGILSPELLTAGQALENQTNITDIFIAGFVFALAFAVAFLIPFVILFALNHQEWLGLALTVIPIGLLCLVVKNRSKPAFYGILSGYSIILISFLQRVIQG